MAFDKRLVKKIGEPKYKDGDKVTTVMTDDKILTIMGEPKSNGLTWMYAFRGDSMRLGQSYIKPAKTDI
jgi:hypothetical protein